MGRRQGRTLVLGLAACIGGVALLAGCATAPGAALVQRPSPTPTERDGSTDNTNSSAYRSFSARQDQVDRYAAWVRSHHGLERHGYVGTVVDPAHLAVTLQWYGHDPVTAALVAGGPRFHVTVRIRPWPQSLQQFQAAQKRLEAAGPELKRLGFTISSIDGIGAEPAPLMAYGRFARGADHAAIARAAARAAGQRVVVRVDASETF